MTFTYTLARVCRSHKDSCYHIVVALARDPIKPGGSIESLTELREVHHDASKPLDYGDVCHVEGNRDEAILVRCGHL